MQDLVHACVKKYKCIYTFIFVYICVHQILHVPYTKSHIPEQPCGCRYSLKINQHSVHTLSLSWAETFFINSFWIDPITILFCLNTWWEQQLTFAQTKVGLSAIHSWMPYIKAPPQEKLSNQEYKKTIG